MHDSLMETRNITVMAVGFMGSGIALVLIELGFKVTIQSQISKKGFCNHF
jgi:3-hydroxyacyl-CoA dehydrogenase